VVVVVFSLALLVFAEAAVAADDDNMILYDLLQVTALCRVLKSSCSLQQGGQGAALSAALTDVMCTWAAWVQSKAISSSPNVSAAANAIHVQGQVCWPGLSPMAMAFVEGSPTHAKVRHLTRNS
jgi:hypothetical protein